MPGKTAPAALLVFDGQSLNYAPGTPAQAFPAGVRAAYQSTVGRVVAIINTTWLQRTVDVATRVDRLLGTCSGTAVLVDCAGTSNLNSGQTAAQILAEAEAYWTARRAAGWDRIVACTVNDSTTFDATEQTTRATLNGLIRASVVPNAVADLAAVANLTDATNVTYYSDGTHFTAAGAALCVAPIITAVGALP